MGLRLPVSLGRKMLRTLLSAENRTLRVFQIPVSLAPLSSKGPSIAIKATLGGPLLISGVVKGRVSLFESTDL